jgi:hypothetical protein
MNAKAGYSLAAIIAVLSYSTLIAGITATIAMVLATIWLGAPGFVIFGHKKTFSNPERSSAILLTGIALSLLGITLVGSLFDHFSFFLALSISPILCMLLGYFQAHGARSQEQTEDSLHSNHKGADIGEIRLLWLSVLIVLALLYLPFIGVGAITEQGATFRPFFNADFFKHLAISNSFLAGHLPPIDPFGATGRLHYYWMQHLLPATALAAAPGLLEPGKVLLAAGIMQTVLMTMLLFGLARRFSGHALAAFVAVLLGIASLSMDGLAAQLLYPTQPWLEVMQTINMEGLDFSELYQIPYHVSGSTLYRLQLYIPQHQLCASFFLAYIFMEKEVRQTGAASSIAGSALLIALPATSILLGVPMLAVVAIMTLVHYLRSRTRPPLSIFVALFIAFVLPISTGMLEFGFANNQMTGVSGVANSSGLPERLAWLPLQWLTTFGPLALLACIGWWWLQAAPERTDDADILSSMLFVSFLGYVAAEWLLQLGRLRVDAELKLSFIASIANIFGSAVFFAGMRQSEGHRRTGRLLLFALFPFFLLGMLSPIHDAVWHSCLKQACANGPGEATTIPASDLEAMDWARKNTRPDAVFQQRPEADFLAGGRDVWVPVFAGRAVLASRRGTNTTPGLLNQTSSLFDPKGKAEVGKLARILGIDYLYLSRAIDPSNYDQDFLRFSRQSDLIKVYSNNGVSIWKVQKG